ncbi:adhesion G protein-coupled receptor L3-like [Hippopotamus amphibius kiboko]|uniref:adhesion G protein-coupled receptor L3-like n=1 Tax=Hippopotamus amphibius kiboko TaxID=575201 RepID=UPI00259A8978|nr:adhesion G protein-coupled receptor L3-like [Hippopotamus amphibius kiboko]
MPEYTTMWPSQLLVFMMLLAPTVRGGKHSERHPALAAPLRHAERSPGGALPPRHLLQQPAAERATAHRGQGPRGATRGVRGPGAQGAQISAQGAASGGERGLGVAGQGLLGGSVPGSGPNVSSHILSVCIHSLWLMFAPSDILACC